MRVLVIGGGGREHALVWRLASDPAVTGVVACPGNPGIAELAQIASGDPLDPGGMVALARAAEVDLTVVGPEAPLERGLADRFAAEGLPIVGPSRTGAALECSKAAAKAFMARHRIPTARARVTASPAEALEAVAGSAFGFPVVVKADGLAAGKGVVIAEDRAEAEAAVRAAMVDRQFGAAGATVVIEECLTGPEVSFFVLADGLCAVPLGTAQDHKRIWDDDKGPNTGGMGAIAPSPLWTDSLERQVMLEVVEPVLAGMAAAGSPYRGFLYVSLMLTPSGPRVIEFNVRLGDPEAQVVLPLVDGSIASLLLAAATGTLRGLRAPVLRRAAVGVVLAARGYPGPVETGQPIRGIDAAGALPDVVVFHAATRAKDGELVTAGGRVLTVVAQAATLAAARARAYGAAALIQFDGMQFRRDIGRKALEGGT